MKPLRGLTAQRFTLVANDALPEHLLPDISHTLAHLGWVRLAEERVEDHGLQILHYRGYTPALVPASNEQRRLLRELGQSLVALNVACMHAAGNYAQLRPTRVVFDMDSTVIREESLDRLAAGVGLGGKCAEITERAMAGELDFAAALRERVALLAGTPAARCSEIGRSLTLTTGAERTLAAFAKTGCEVVIASGGFHQIIAPITEALPVDLVVANRFEIRDGVLTGKVSGEIVTAQTKRELAGELDGISVAVGDGANDMLMLRQADVGIAFSHRDNVRAAADVVVPFARLDALISLLGLPDS